MKRPAATSSAIDSAIWAVTSPLRKRAAERAPVSCPALERMVVTRSGRVLCSAGNIPKTSPVPSDTSAVTNSMVGCSPSRTIAA